MAQLRLWNFDLPLTSGVECQFENGIHAIRFLFSEPDNRIEIAVKSTNKLWVVDLKIIAKVTVDRFGVLVFQQVQSSVITKFKWLSKPTLTFVPVIDNAKLYFRVNGVVPEPLDELSQLNINALNGLLNLSGINKINLGQISNGNVGFDFTDTVIVVFHFNLRPEANYLSFNEDIRGQLTTIFRKSLSQKLIPLNIGIFQNAGTNIIHINFVPFNKSTGNFVYVNPYIFHTLKDSNNLVAYQYALANGILRLDSSQNRWYWIKGIILLLNYTDHNGNPLPLSSETIELIDRRGLQSIVQSSNNIELINQGIGIKSITNDTTYPVDSIEPRSISNVLKNKQLYEKIDTVGDLAIERKPFWLAADGTVKLTGKRPPEFYGQSKGTIYVPKEEKIDARLPGEDIVDTKGTIYRTSQLEFAYKDLQIHTLMEEKESFTTSSALTGNAKVARRSFINDNPEPITLPATNYKIAATNVFNPNPPPGTASVTIISEKVGKWVNDIQVNLRKLQASNETIEHESGFQRAEGAAVSPNQFFSQAPKKSFNFLDTAPINLELQRIDTPAKFIHGAKDAAESNPFVSNSRRIQLKSSITASFITDVEVEIAEHAATSDVLKGLRRLKRFWNECASIPDDDAKPWKALKFYFQKGPDELIRLMNAVENNTAQLDDLNDIRGKFEEFIGSKNLASPQALKALGDVKLLVNGNINTIAGLGTRAQQVLEIINTLDVQTLKKFWDNTWTKDVKTESDKVIFELLNYYYYPFEKKTVTELARLNKILLGTDLTAAETNLHKAFKYFHNDYTGLFTDINELLQTEIADLSGQADAEIKKLISEAWIDVDPYVTHLEKIWKYEIPVPTDLATIKNNLDTLVTNPLPAWGAVSATISKNFRMDGIWAVIEADAKAAWVPAVNTADNVWTMYSNFLTKLRQIKANYGPYFNPNAYQQILKDLAKGASSELSFLENSLKKQIAAEFRNALEKNLAQDIAAYEEDLLVLGRQFKKWSSVFDLTKNEIKEVLAITAQELADEVEVAKKILKLTQHTDIYEAFKFAFLDVAKLSFQPVQLQLQAFVKEHKKQILDVLGFLNTIKIPNGVISEIFADFDDVRTDFERIAFKLREVPSRITALIDSYLKYKYDQYISLADLRLQPPEYIVYGKNVAYNVEPSIVNKYNTIVEKLFGSKFTLTSFKNGEKWNVVQAESSVYILKLGNNVTLDQIIRQVEDNNTKISGVNPFNWTADDRAKFISELPTELNTKYWRGIFIVNPQADITKDESLKKLLGTSHFKMPYAAIGGKEIKSGDLDLYARIKDKKDALPAEQGEQETEFTITSFDATVKNTTLISGSIESVLTIRSVLGHVFTPPVSVIITGSLPAKSDATSTGSSQGFEFSARLESPLELPLDYAFFEKITVTRIRAANRKEKCFLELDATVSFKEFAGAAGLKSVALQNFRIEVPAITGGASVKLGQARLLDFDMEAIEFILNKPRPLTMLGMELLPTGIGYTKSYSEELFKSYFRCLGEFPTPGKKVAYIKLDVNLGNLTSLGSTDGQSLKFTGALAYKLEDKKLFFGISGGEFKNIDINLFRFIQLKIEELTLANDVQLNGNHEQTKSSVIYAKNAQLNLLNWPVFGKDGKISLLLLNEQDEKNRKGFYFFYKNATPEGFLKIYWVLIGRGIVLPPDVLSNLLIATDGVDPTSLNLPQTQQLQVPNPDPKDKFKELAFANDSNWLVGASFAIGDILERCTFILHDNHYYGIMVSSKKAWFKALFGGDKIALAYIPGRTKKEDRFRIETPLPFLNFFGALKSGMFAMEIGVNKDFLFDLGYPWRVGNRYEWPRAFSARQGIYEIKLGLYFEKRTEYLEDATGQEQSLLTIGAGIGLYYGYYVGGRTPIAWAEAGVGLFIILAGRATFRLQGSSGLDLLSASLVSIEVIGVIGIYAYAEGGVDYWVISATFRVEIQAAIQGRLLYLPHGGSSLTYEAMLSARFSASARIKLGFIRVRVSISGQVELYVGGKIALN
jgi:hypothetical protein